jgi:hypothetical protein
MNFSKSKSVISISFKGTEGILSYIYVHLEVPRFLKNHIYKIASVSCNELPKFGNCYLMDRPIP